ncbi:MAG: DUF2970 domain-containing protein [Methylococcales bacterium]|nr:DUF2970 domain-containing protein [Methylococcales bacterium]
MSTSTFFQVVKSVLAAFIGVQSKTNQEQDFTNGKLSSYIFVGIITTIFFIISLIAIRLVL